MNINNLCVNCMKEKHRAEMVCPFCGFYEKTDPQETEYLNYWTVLGGKYLVGKALGQGGFGITYVGYDMNLEMKVAIKEYYPYDYAYRDHRKSNKVYPLNIHCKEFFKQEKQNFIEEARILAMCNELPGIVKVRDYFQENETCYIVMEFLEGVTLVDYVKEHGGRVPADTVFRLMEPVIRSMIQIHKHGVIHKDISPDNIMFGKNKKVKLIDFGAAQRDFKNGQNNDIYKESFSPPEQRDGTWRVDTYSDIYAFCATMYYCMTGSVPQDSLERQEYDCLRKPSELGIEISSVQEAALMKGLELNPDDRIGDAEDLYFFLYMYGQNNGNADAMKQAIADKKTAELTRKIKANKDKINYKKWIIAAVIVLCVGVFAHFILQNLGQLRGAGTDLSAYAEMTEAQQSKLEEDFYNAAVKEHKSYGALEMDATLQADAEAVAEILEEKGGLNTDWNSLYSEATETVYESRVGDKFCWMIIPITEETDEKNVLKQGLANEGNRTMFQQCNHMGVSVFYHESGQLFYVILMK